MKWLSKPMKTVMENLEPQSLWRHFEALSAIPRASEKEAAARSYVLAQAARLGLESTGTVSATS